jgi:hypothetical protein
VTSPVYWHPFIYGVFMRLLYGRGFSDRYHAVAARIPINASLLELCAGDCLLYTRFLVQKKISYTACDINPIFINAARKKGISAIRLDVLNETLPNADIVLMQASLYQFIPHQKAIVDKMLEAARKRVIIVEPVKNLSDSQNPMIAFLARRSANPGTGNKTTRFNAETFSVFLKDNYPSLIIEKALIASGREMLAVLGALKKP